VPARRKSSDSRKKSGGRAKARGKSKKAPRKPGGRKTAKKAPRTAPASKRSLAHRLTADVRPGDVDLHLTVDPTAGDAFEGEVRHVLRLGRSRRTLELHAADLRVSRPRVTWGGRTRRGRLVRRPDRETVQIELDESIPAGEAVLELAFRGKLRSDLRGLYAAHAGERKYAFTQLEAADARRFFPCFDEPAFKARFQISVTTGRKHTVLSNGRATKVEPVPGRRKTVHFERTPLLSTYLLALAVGELVASEPTHCGKTEIRIWHVPGKEALTAFGLETGRETLKRLEAYFDLPYPYSKLDLVAAPDFEAGAMENAGAVFFRETLLLVDPETATLQEKKRVAEVVCHELAHMWYGDLVTMAWWDDLWLNEAFATWMAFQIVDAWQPDWKMWNDFQHYRSAALGMDALAQTHPIYTKVRSPAEATENFDLITYEKGASVVRMLERYLGPETFRAGVRQYIREHAEANTVAADLWEALSEASGQDVEPIVRAWIEEPGFPLLQLRRGTRAGKPVLRYKQERFRADPRSTSGGSEEPWPIPWVGHAVDSSGARPVRALLVKRAGEVKLGGAARFVYGNADEGGFFRPLHEDAELQAMAADKQELGAVERMGLLGHQWAAVRSGRAALGGYLDLALAFADEAEPDVLLTLQAPLGTTARMAERTLGPEAATALRDRIAASFGPAFEAAGWRAGAREGDEGRLRRAALLGLAGSVGQRPEILAAAREHCDAYLADRTSLEPNLADTVVALAARDGDAGLFERLLKASRKATSPQEQRRFQFAAGSFRDPQLVERAQALCLSDAIGTQDVAILLTRLLQNPAAAPSTWAFMKRRWTKLRRRMPPMLVTRPIEALPALGTRAARREVAAFFRANPVATGARAVKQTLEQFDLELAFAERAGPELSTWLRRAAPTS
jgi:puromycin-sensitive aminopeptidase